MKLRQTAPPPPSDQDTWLIHQYLLHTVLLEMLEADVQLLPELSLQMSELYVMRLSDLQSGVKASLQTIRQHMRYQGIRIQKIARHAIGLEAHYLCRGYHQYVILLDSQMQSRIVEYLSTTNKSCPK